jgi:hypothetical protein
MKGIFQSHPHQTNHKATMNQHAALINNILMRHRTGNDNTYWWNTQDEVIDEDAILAIEMAMEMFHLLNGDEAAFRTHIHDELIFNEVFERQDWIDEVFANMNDDEKHTTETYLQLAALSLENFKTDFIYIHEQNNN